MNPPGERRHAQHKGPPVSGERFGALELMQALQLGHAVAALHALGVMDALSIARRPEDLGRQFGLDAALLRGLLDHAARATDLVRRQGRRYRRTRAWNREARFLVGLDGVGRYVDDAAQPDGACEARLGRCRHAVPTRQARSTLASRRCSQRGGAALGYRSGR